MTQFMVERVARALAHSYGSRIVGLGMSEASRRFTWGPNGEHMEKYVEVCWPDWRHAAEFAIQAMREPTEAVLTAAVARLVADDGMVTTERYYLTPGIVGWCFNAMIDEALRDG